MNDGPRAIVHAREAWRERTGWLSHVVKSITNQASRVWDQTQGFGNRAGQGKAFGSSSYGRFLANATGATTTANLSRRALRHQRVEPNNVIQDARVMRPGQAYSNGMAGPAHDAMESAAAAQAANDAALAKQQQSDEQFARGQLEVTSRRRQRAKRASTKGGTLLTGAMGIVDTSTTGGGAGALLTGG